MKRNKTKFFYASYEKKKAIIDEYGNETGEQEILHNNPVEGYANVSAAQGEMQTRQFGENESYDKVIVIDENSYPIDEYSILWIDTMPKLNEDGSLATNAKGEIITPHDYVVKKIARSMNFVSIAISKVTISG